MLNIYYNQFNLEDVSQKSYEPWNAYLTYTGPDRRMTEVNR